MSKIGSANATCRHKPDQLSLHPWSMSFARLAARRQSQQSCALGRTLSRWPLLIRAKSASADFRPDLRGGGAYRDRTDDPLLAKQVLSQLS